MSEYNLECRSLSLTLFETGSLVFHCCMDRVAVPQVLGDSLSLIFTVLQEQWVTDVSQHHDGGTDKSETRSQASRAGNCSRNRCYSLDFLFWGPQASSTEAAICFAWSIDLTVNGV